MKRLICDQTNYNELVLEAVQKVGKKVNIHFFENVGFEKFLFVLGETPENARAWSVILDSSDRMMRLLISHTSQVGGCLKMLF